MSQSPASEHSHPATPQSAIHDHLSSTLVAFPTHSSSSNLTSNSSNEQTAFGQNSSNVVISLRASDTITETGIQVENDDDYCDDEPETPLSENASPTRSRLTKVRFRSRVRITSGLNRRRKASLKEEQQQNGYLTFNSSTSDLSGSPSSSISAPLRTHAQEAIGKPGWGTLGQRVSMFARGNGPNRKQRDVRTKIIRRSRVINVPNNPLNERTPLMAEAGQPQRGGVEDVTGVVMNEEELAREIDITFGSWPYRLINHHWWWWYIEPVVCCQCLTDSDDEG